MDGLRNLSQYGRDSPYETEDDGEAPGCLSHGEFSDAQFNDGDDYSSDGGSQRSIEFGGEGNCNHGYASDFDTDFRAMGDEEEEQQRAARAERN